ncbi:MAG: AAA family ATPase [Thermoplasmatota archaeon]
MTENPFEYRLIAKGKNFIDREKELETIERSVKSGQNITLYSPRRFGKSSLILESYRRLGEVIPIYIDFNKVNSVSELADRLVSSTTERVYSTIEKGFSDIRELLFSLRPTFTPTEEGGLSISLKVVENEKDIEKMLEYPQKLAEKKNINIVIAMDEFQRISTLDGDKLERLFRSIIQEQDRVTYIFSGSQVNMLKEMFERGDRPFFKSTKIMKLSRIPKENFRGYILKRFEETGLEVDKQLIDDILDFTEGHPMRTKQLCFELWNKKISNESVKSLEDLLNIMIENDIYIEEVWNSITSAVQRRALEAIANKEKPYSYKTIEKYELKGSSHVQRAIKSLEREGILYEGEIVDPFLEEWIRRESK